MKKTCMAMSVVLLTLLCSSSAMAWGSATHAYIDERLNNKGPLLTLNQVYGGMAVDTFNFLLNQQYQAYLSTKAHCLDCDDMWRVALLPTAKALAFGFVSHNQAWGADWYAHNYGCPYNEPPTTGYIEDMATLLLKDSQLAGALASLNLPDAVAKELLRDLIEYAVDILITQNDPAIGQKISAAALLRSPEFPLMLNAAYARDFSKNLNVRYTDAVKIITAAEQSFRQTTAGYGQILALGYPGAVQPLSVELANLAQQLFHVTVNPLLVQQLLEVTIGACSSDFMNYMNGPKGIEETIFGVRRQMKTLGFWY